MHMVVLLFVLLATNSLLEVPLNATPSWKAKLETYEKPDQI